MKKLALIGASVVALSAINSGVFAEQMTTPGQTTVQADYTVSESYRVEIPAAVDFASASSPFETNIKVSDSLLESGSQLKISMTSEYGKLKNGDTSYINYDIDYSGTGIQVEQDISYTLLTVQAGENDEKNISITFTPKGLENVTLAGRHADTLTFSIQVGPAPTYAMLSAPTVYANDEGSLSFRSEAPLSDFEHLELDNQTVPSDQYELTSGSTIITLKSSFARLIGKGSHTLRIYSTGGYAEADFVKAFESQVNKTMQNIAELRSTFDMNPEQQLTDERDGKIYWVRKMADGNIWMTQNLDYQPTALYISDNIYYANGIATTGTSLEGVPADSPLRHYAAGSYYDWYSAQEACPSGWEVPERYSTMLFAEEINEGTAATQSPFYAVFGGVGVTSTIIYEIGQEGYYWLSTEHKSYGDYQGFTVNGSYPLMEDQTWGYSVRCVASE